MSQSLEEIVTDWTAKLADCVNDVDSLRLTLRMYFRVVNWPLTMTCIEFVYEGLNLPQMDTLMRLKRGLRSWADTLTPTQKERLTFVFRHEFRSALCFESGLLVMNHGSVRF